jgi:hypothetical protein
MMMVALPIISALGQAQEQLDLQALTRLKAEAYNHSQAMETVSWLADVYGPPLTGAPGMQGAANYLEKRMKEFGLSNVHRETFPFGRSWANTRFYLHEISPQTFPLIGSLIGFTGGTNGWVKGDVVLLDVDPWSLATEENKAKYAGKLKGKFVLPPKSEPFSRLSRVRIVITLLVPWGFVALGYWTLKNGRY